MLSCIMVFAEWMQKSETLNSNVVVSAGEAFDPPLMLTGFSILFPPISGTTARTVTNSFALFYVRGSFTNSTAVISTSMTGNYFRTNGINLLVGRNDALLFTNSSYTRGILVVDFQK